MAHWSHTYVFVTAVLAHCATMTDHTKEQNIHEITRLEKQICELRQKLSTEESNDKVKEQCPHDRSILLDISPRDNGVFTTQCVRCGLIT